MTGVQTAPLGGLVARERPAFGLRPTVRFTLAVIGTVAWVGFSVWVSDGWRDELEEAIGPVAAWVIPVMIAEIGCAPDRRKPAWITDALNSARADGVDAVVWFEFNKETDWRLAENAATANAARSVLKGRAWVRGGDTIAVERAVLG